MLKKILVLMLAASAITLKTLAYEATQKEERSFRIKFGGHITIIGDEGYIKIRSWDKEEVVLRMTKRAWERSRAKAEARLEEIEVEIEHSANRLFIRQVDRGEGREFSFWDIFNPDRWRDIQVDFDLTVPRRINLKIENNEGDVEITEVQGSIHINVDEGRVKIEKGSFSKLHIYCDEGDIILTQIRSRESSCRTDEGNIEAEIDIMKEGKYRLITDEGDVFTILPKDADVRIRLETESGYIRTDFPLSIKEWEEGQRAEGIIGKGKARLNIYTDEGDIFLEEK